MQNRTPSLLEESESPETKSDIQVFREWKMKYNKRYGSPEVEQYRMEIYFTNLLYIEAENAMDNTYKLGVNQFMDLTTEEWQATYLMIRDD